MLIGGSDRDNCVILNLKWQEGVVLAENPGHKSQKLITKDIIKEYSTGAFPSNTASGSRLFYFMGCTPMTNGVDDNAGMTRVKDTVSVAPKAISPVFIMS